MCGIACYLGRNKEEGLKYGNTARVRLQHRGPDDNGIYNDEHVTLAQTRLSILDLSQSGHQPMESSCGRYVIAYNGEIYNHLELRKQYLAAHPFRGHSDTETIIELFRLKREAMTQDMVGMWAIIIWDKQTKKIFISRSRFGQKPLYVRLKNNTWLLASEVRPMLQDNEHPAADPTALVEYLALGNYGHLGVHTFFRDIQQFPEGCYAWLAEGEQKIDAKSYWTLPDIREKDKVPFDAKVKKGLHDSIVNAVLSQTLSDVPIGITLSGGIDSAIIAGILATHYKKDLHIFTAQSPNSKYDETKYVDAVINKYGQDSFRVHREDLNELSIKDTLRQYIGIQEEPFGDPSIVAHGSLMKMAAGIGIKVILNGQGADEFFFGYNNMARVILSRQFKSMQLQKFYKNLSAMKLGKNYFLRTVLESFFPTLEYNLRTKSRIKRRDNIQTGLLENVDNNLISLFKYNKAYDVWRESIYGVHIPHLVHYDDRNAMAFSIEGRMPFLDHRVAEYVSTIRSDEFLKNGLRKYILRESCKEYLPQIIYDRKDKIGFYTPLVNALYKDRVWVADQLKSNNMLNNTTDLLAKLNANTLNVNEGLQIWKTLSVSIWMDEFNVKTDIS